LDLRAPIPADFATVRKALAAAARREARARG